MDPEDLPALYESLCTTKETSVKLWWLNDTTKSDEVTLDDNGVRNSLQTIRASVIQSSTIEDVNRQFVLVSSTGDPAYKNKPLRVARNTLVAILDACEFPSYTLVSCGVKRFHLSHNVQYGDKDEPVALILLLRIPRNSQSINVVMRIRLCDLATVCFFTTMKEETGQGLIEKCSERSHLLKVHPLYFLALVFEERCLEYKEWFDKILEEINVVESATGMTRATWRVKLSDTLMDWFSDYDNLLRTLYAIHTELSHFDTVTTFSIKIGKFLLKVLELSEDLRVESGHERMSKREYGTLQQRIQFSLSRCELSSDKTREMLERVKGQINVAFSLVSQRDSKINLAVAEDSRHVAILAARDSETMKTITVLTLLFLPSSLVTSIWSAGLFHLHQSRNWKIYLGTNLALTAGVFAVWLSYLKWSGLRREEKPLHIASWHRASLPRREGPLIDLRRETSWNQ